MTAVATPRQAGALGVDAPPRYMPAPPPFSIAGVRVCAECGAVVLAVKAHNRFHSMLAGLGVRLGEQEERVTNTRERLTRAERKLDGRSRPRKTGETGADGT